MPLSYTCCTTGYLLTFFAITEGLKHCYIAYKDWLLWWIFSCFSGYVYLSTITHICWTAIINFFSTEGKECLSMLQSHVSWCFVTFSAISTLDNWSSFWICLSNDILQKVYASFHADLSPYGLQNYIGSGSIPVCSVI